jgi:dihydrofolate synthase/folylpolyglutamate synthase
MRADELIDWIHGARRFGEKKGALQHGGAAGRAGAYPEAALRCVHIAGTNAKGSVAALIESALRQNGCATGLYTSPFLIRYAERIRMDGRPVDDGLFDGRRAAYTRRRRALRASRPHPLNWAPPSRSPPSRGAGWTRR